MTQTVISSSWSAIPYIATLSPSETGSVAHLSQLRLDSVAPIRTVCLTPLDYTTCQWEICSDNHQPGPFRGIRSEIYQPEATKFLKIWSARNHGLLHTGSWYRLVPDDLRSHAAQIGYPFACFLASRWLGKILAHHGDSALPLFAWESGLRQEGPQAHRYPSPTRGILPPPYPRAVPTVREPYVTIWKNVKVRHSVIIMSRCLDHIGCTAPVSHILMALPEAWIRGLLLPLLEHRNIYIITMLPHLAGGLLVFHFLVAHVAAAFYEDTKFLSSIDVFDYVIVGGILAFSSLCLSILMVLISRRNRWVCACQSSHRGYQCQGPVTGSRFIVSFQWMLWLSSSRISSNLPWYQ